MKRKEKDNKDQHLQAPAEANRDKHINFLQVEEDDSTSSNKDEKNTNEDRADPDVQKEWDDLREDKDYNRE